MHLHSHGHSHNHHGHHHHGHAHGAEDPNGSGSSVSESSLARIRFAFFMNLSFTVIEIVGGIWTGSYAVLSDALHDLGDSLALGLSYILEKISKKRRDQRFSYGYRRFSLLAALINGMVLVAGAMVILYFTIPALSDQSHRVHGQGVLLLAVLGILFNGIGVWRLAKGGNMNERMLTWHLLEDVFGWITILISSLLIIFFDWQFLDPLLSIIFVMITLYNVVRLVKRTLMIFLQSVPDSLDVSHLEQSIAGIKGVDSVHDTHLWSLDGDFNVLTIHVVIGDDVPDSLIMKLKKQIHDLLIAHDVHHSTIEMERIDEACILRGC